MVDYKPEDFNLDYEDAVFESTDGLKLSGWFIPHNKSKDAIIVMHGYPANKADLLPVALFLNKKYDVFLFDFRSFGQSEGKYTTAGFKEVKDLEGAIGFLKQEKKIRNIGAFGFSLGGAVALMSKNNEIKAIVADSSYASLDRMVEALYRNFFFLKSLHRLPRKVQLLNRHSWKNHKPKAQLKTFWRRAKIKPAQ